jgi:hypothetical protein
VGVRYALTDFRIVRVDRARSTEVALHDVVDVQRRRSWVDRLAGTSTLLVYARDRQRPPLVLGHLRRGAQLGALIELLAGDPQASLDPEGVRAALAWQPPSPRRPHPGPIAGAGIMVLLAIIFGVAIGLQGTGPSITFPPDDAIYPNGRKRDREAIVRFMETEVMPWARVALAPIVGGADAVTCWTCHGSDGAANQWRMPAVAALPEPHFRLLGWELSRAGMDPQMRNAIYGYVAEPEKQSRARYMRDVVMPGMARLLRRPSYDFTKTYEYNRSRLAFGCYHCHQIG